MSRDRSRTLALAVPLLVILTWAVVYPNAHVIAGSFGENLAHWREFFASPGDREAVVNTIIISVGSVVAAVAIGLPLAFLLTRYEFPGRRILRIVAVLPAALPPLVGVIAFLFLYGESGLVTRAVQYTLRLDDPPWRLTGLPAIIFVHAYTMYVFVFLFVSAALERLDSSVEEAAAGLGAGTARRLTRVTLPLLLPAIAGSMLLVFMNSLGSFSAPYVFGGGERVLSTQIFASKLIGALGLAYAETTVLTASAIAGLILFRFMERRRVQVATGRGTRTRRSVRSHGMQTLLTVLGFAAVVFLILPHLMVILVSFARDGAWTTQVLPPEYTLENYRRLASDSELWRPIRNSVSMASLATAANVMVALLAAYLLVLRRWPGRRLLDLLVTLPWAIPATAIAIGLAATFDQNDAATARVLLVGTFWILPFAYFIRNVPLVVTPTAASLRQMDPSLEDAARGLGASWWLMMRRVVLPAARPGLIAGALLGAVTAVGDFVTSIVLYTHANRPISIEILAQLRSLAFGTAAAYSVMLIVLVAIITFAARALEEQYTPRT